MEETIWKNYVGVKIVRATPMNEVEFLRVVKDMNVENEADQEGYLVTYPAISNGQPYQSWVPKDVFKSDFRELTEIEVRMVQDEQ